MRYKLITLLGRVGSTLIAIGLAFALVLSIPGKPVTGTFQPRYYVYPGGCYYVFPPPAILAPSPQYGHRISVTLNSSLQVYFIAEHHLQLREKFSSWIKENYPLLNETQVLMGMYNASVFEAFLKTRPPEEILLKETVNGEWSLDFFPREATNVTLMFVNPSPTLIIVNMKITGISIPLPKYHAIMITQTLLISGAVLALPWLLKKIKDYVKSKSIT